MRMQEKDKNTGKTAKTRTRTFDEPQPTVTVTDEIATVDPVKKTKSKKTGSRTVTKD